jgi:hypothetical protein
VESKRVYSVESSGYETSPVISSDNNMDIHPSLEDDDSLNDAMLLINLDNQGDVNELDTLC